MNPFKSTFIFSGKRSLLNPTDHLNSLIFCRPLFFPLFSCCQHITYNRYNKKYKQVSTLMTHELIELITTYEDRYNLKVFKVLTVPSIFSQESQNTELRRAVIARSRWC